MDNLLEKALEKLLLRLSEEVFIKSTNSITDEVEHLDPIIEDMEAIIAISGEWDREDLKKILKEIMNLGKD